MTFRGEDDDEREREEATDRSMDLRGLVFGAWAR